MNPTIYTAINLNNDIANCLMGALYLLTRQLHSQKPWPLFAQLTQAVEEKQIKLHNKTVVIRVNQSDDHLPNTAVFKLSHPITWRPTNASVDLIVVEFNSQSHEPNNETTVQTWQRDLAVMTQVGQ